MTFYQDESRIRDRNMDENIAWLRRLGSGDAVVRGRVRPRLLTAGRILCSLGWVIHGWPLVEVGKV
ncbi:MAG: hypothetical protein ACYTG0_21275 [Planctomycetota bacterium]|jgi:hypothetical protein